MKTKIITVTLLLTVWFAHAQGIFVYDQQSTNLAEGVASLQFSQPMGQSFTPSLSAIEFVSLYLFDGDFENALGGTVLVNLRSDSITGTILSSTAPVFIPDGFFGTTNFSFNTTVAINPGTIYYLEPVIQSGNPDIGSYITDASYTGGSEIYQGSPISDRNLWFQEGIIAVPEPSSALLALFGSGAWFFIRRQRTR
jgi:hypothetical protein